MVHSMTAFARSQTAFAGIALAWELRSVNHRYLEPGFKLPDALRAIETQLRERLRGRVQRGKVECTLRLQTEEQPYRLTLDLALVDQLLDCAQQIQARAPVCGPINALELLAWPGVMVAPAADEEQLHAAAITSFEQALAELVATRAREGAGLATIITRQLDRLEGIVASVRESLPAILAAQRERLRNRLAELQSAADPDRLEQELVILAQKSDIAEELDRLQTHALEARRALGQPGPCGRRLDFLMQELNREANTLSSKALVHETTNAAVELKVIIEQMREQIQNLE